MTMTAVTVVLHIDHDGPWTPAHAAAIAPTLEAEALHDAEGNRHGLSAIIDTVTVIGVDTE